MKKIAQIEFYENANPDFPASATVRLYDDSGEMIHGNLFPDGLLDKIEDSLMNLRYIFAEVNHDKD